MASDAIVQLALSGGRPCTKPCASYNPMRWPERASQILLLGVLGVRAGCSREAWRRMIVVRCVGT
eukprot:6066535-Amphidinium_carterae.1